MEDATVNIDLHDVPLGAVEHANINHLAKSLQQVLDAAQLCGFVITVDLQPLEPLAMGNYRMVGNVRKGCK